MRLWLEKFKDEKCMAFMVLNYVTVSTNAIEPYLASPFLRFAPKLLLIPVYPPVMCGWFMYERLLAQNFPVSDLSSFRDILIKYTARLDASPRQR